MPGKKKNKIELRKKIAQSKPSDDVKGKATTESEPSEYDGDTSEYTSGDDSEYTHEQSDTETDDDNSDDDDSHAWCINCKKLIQTPFYESVAHFHSGKLDLWLCAKCFPVNLKDKKSCKCVIHCTLCRRDISYNEDCTPFSNTSRGFCDTCTNKIKSIVLSTSTTNPKSPKSPKSPGRLSTTNPTSALPS